jgi:hypothetical protein
VGGKPRRIGGTQKNKPHKGHAGKLLSPGNRRRQGVMLKDPNILRKGVKKAEYQPEYNLQKKQTYKKHQQNLTKIALDIVQKLKYRFGSHK